MCLESDAFPFLFLDGLLDLRIARRNDSNDTQNKPSQERHGDDTTRKPAPASPVSLSPVRTRGWQRAGSTSCGDGRRCLFDTPAQTETRWADLQSLRNGGRVRDWA